MNIIRTKRGVLAAHYLPGYGQVLRPADDPQGVEIPKAMLEGIRLDDIPKMPKDLIEKIVGFYVAYLREGANVADAESEAGVVLLRDTQTLSRWRVLVPTQEVGGASVDIDFSKPLVDIETGEKVEAWPPNGWAHAGSSHSHNTMGAFFSGTDDKSELPVNGLHFVLGSFAKKEKGWTCSAAVSVVYNNVRYQRVIMEDGNLRDMTLGDFCVLPEDPVDPHKNVHDVVKRITYPIASSIPSIYGGIGDDWESWGGGYKGSSYQTYHPKESDRPPRWTNSYLNTPKNYSEFHRMAEDKGVRWVYTVYSSRVLDKRFTGDEVVIKRLQRKDADFVQQRTGDNTFIRGELGYDAVSIQTFILLSDNTWALCMPMAAEGVSAHIQRQREEASSKGKIPDKRKDKVEKATFKFKGTGPLSGITPLDFKASDIEAILDDWLKLAESGDVELAAIFYDVARHVDSIMEDDDLDNIGKDENKNIMGGD